MTSAQMTMIITASSLFVSSFVGLTLSNFLMLLTFVVVALFGSYMIVKAGSDQTLRNIEEIGPNLSRTINRAMFLRHKTSSGQSKVTSDTMRNKKS